jgi:dihydroxyacetone kinase-like predicted kinase
MTSAGLCKPGDILGVVGGDILEIDDNVQDVARATLSRLMGIGGELVTVVTGEDANPDDVTAVENLLHREYPGVEVVVYEGGHPFWPMIFGVE